MATIHHTTLVPYKLDLLTAWLPAQPWYLDAGHTPSLRKAGGFRLDDPEGEVGIEFMIVTDVTSGDPVTYHVPLTYRAQPQPGMQDGLVGTAEHGVLGTRYVYDGVYDWVLVTQLVALMQGQAEPQAQSLSDTPDPAVQARPVVAGYDLVVTGCALGSNGPDGTRLRLVAAIADEQSDLVLRIIRALPAGTAATDERAGQVRTPWRLEDGTETSGVIATAARTDG